MTAGAFSCFSVFKLNKLESLPPSCSWYLYSQLTRSVMLTWFLEGHCFAVWREQAMSPGMFVSIVSSLLQHD